MPGVLAMKTQSTYNREARQSWPAEVEKSVNGLRNLLDASQDRVRRLERREYLLADALMCAVELHKGREHQTDDAIDRYERALNALADDGFSGRPRR
jgi:hypothetical protein